MSDRSEQLLGKWVGDSGLQTCSLIFVLSPFLPQSGPTITPVALDFYQDVALRLVEQGP